MDQNDFKPLATSVDSQMLDNFLTVIKSTDITYNEYNLDFFWKLSAKFFLADSTSPVALIYYKMQKIVKESKWNPLNEMMGYNISYHKA